MFSRIVAKRTVAALASSTPSSTSKVLAINEFTKRWMADAYFIHPQEVTDRVVAVIQRFDKIVDKDKVTGTSHFNKDLGLDSLDGVEVVLALEDEFGIEIPDADSEKIQSVQDAVKFISVHPTAK